jgi:hypothetical protein
MFQKSVNINLGPDDRLCLWSGGLNSTAELFGTTAREQVSTCSFFPVKENQRQKGSLVFDNWFDLLAKLVN